MNKIPENEVNAALDAAYKRAGSNAYFASGFRAGIEFAQKKTARRNYMKAKELAAQLMEHPDFEVEFSLFELKVSPYGMELRRFSIQVDDIGYSDKIVVLGPTEEL